MPTMQDIQDQVVDLKKEIEELRTLFSDSGHGSIVNHGKRLDVDVSMRLSDIDQRITNNQKTIVAVPESYWNKDVVAGQIFPLTSTDKVRIDNIPNEATDVDKFLVSNNGEIRYRTGDELADDIGAIPFWKQNDTVLSPATDGDSISIEDNLYSKQSDGNYFGRTHLTENQLTIDNIGVVWKEVASAKRWTGIAMSSDGRYQTATEEAGLWKSEDYGLTWADVEPTDKQWMDIAMSSDGKYQTAVSWGDGGFDTAYIYVSSDFGENWTQKDDKTHWLRIAMSSDGKYQSATNGNLSTVYISSDYGVTWTGVSIGTDAGTRGIAMSSDGKYQTTCENTGPGHIFRSTDYGVTWTDTEVEVMLDRIVMSSDGKYQSGVNEDDGVWVSSDYGVSWAEESVTADWTGIAMSSDGRIQIVGEDTLMLSLDYGATWNDIPTAPVHINVRWHGLAMSSDGKIISAGSYDLNDNIWVSYSDSIIHGVFELQQPGYEDLQVNISNIRTPPANAPTQRLYNHGIGGGVTFPVLGFAVGEYIYFDIQTSHGMKLNTIIENHMHFILPNTTNIGDKWKFQLDVIVAAENVAYAVPAGSPFTAEHTIVANDNTHHRQLDIAEIPSSNSTVSTIYSCVLTRIAASADEYGSEVYLKFDDSHYQKNTMASREKRVK